MGLFWGSSIAQRTLFGIAAQARLDSFRVLAGDAPLPETFDRAFAVATGDLMFFFHSWPRCPALVIERFETTLAASGADQNRDKDVAETLNSTRVGVDLVDDRQW